MALRQCMIVFCLLLLVTLANSYSMKFVMDRLNALETKIESSEKRLETENKLRLSETEELFRMISELAGGKILSRSEQLTPDENITPSEQLATKSPLADEYKTTELAIELRDLESYIKGVAAEKQQNVKLRSELKSIGKQLEADYTMFESRIKEEIRNFTNDISEKLTLLVSEERFNNLRDFVTIRQSELRNETRQYLMKFKSDVETSIQNLSSDLHTVNQTANNISDSLRLATTTAVSEVRNETRQSLTSFKSDVKASIQELSNALHTVNQTAMENVERCNNVSDSLAVVSNDLREVININPCKNAPESRRINYMYHAESPLAIRVYCDQKTDGGGWLVIQRRKDGSVNFERTWADYKTGFGDIEGEFWIGNDILHALTSSGLNELRIDMKDFEGQTAFAKYSHFKVHAESDLYRLEVSGYSGDAKDSLTWPHNGMPFSTKDRDNDVWRDGSCTVQQRGAWWHHYCGYSNLNGFYYPDGRSPWLKGIFWYDWKGGEYSLKAVEMKIR